MTERQKRKMNRGLALLAQEMLRNGKDHSTFTVNVEEGQIKFLVVCTGVTPADGYSPRTDNVSGR